MDNPGTSGLRLLSLDGGGIRGLSMLIILEDLMWKLKVAEDLPDVPRPCDYFDLIGGTSTGGLIALMVGRLRMNVKDAVKAYGELSKEVFSDVKSQGSNGRFKASKLEKAIKGIVGLIPPPGPRRGDERHSREHLQNAGRATSAAPTFFKQIQIGPPGIEEAFVDGGMGHNNPIAALLLEAQVLFPDCQIACIISLGTGQPHTITIPKPSLLKRVFPLDVIEAIKGIATDCEKQHQLFAHHFDPVPHVYFRFNVERGMQDIQSNQWERLGDVVANTRQYLLSHPVQNQLADAGRQDILEKMDEYFSRDIGERHTYVLHGLGGSGKTQIALKFLDMNNRHQAPGFTKQFFINASSLQTLDTALKNIAIAHKIGKNSEDGLLWLISQREEWMLLFDNADDLSIDLFHFFPRCTHGNIIITSRNPQLAVHGPRSHSRVGDMDKSDAIDLLLLSAAKEKTIESTQSASEIVEFGQLSKAAARFLQLCSLLHHESIPETIFEQAVGWTAYGDEQEAQTLQEARRFLHNFLHNISHTLSIHPLVHSWCQHTLDDEAIAQGCMTDIMGKSIRLTDDAYLFRIGLMPHIDSLICDHTTIKFREAEFLEVMVLEKWKQLLGADHPDTLLAMGNLAVIYGQLGSYQEAESLQGIVLEKRKQLLGADHPLTLLAMANLAVTYSQLGRYQDAEPLEGIVLERWKQLLGADHPDTLLAMANLAVTYSQLGRYQEAEPLEGIVLEKRKQLLVVRVGSRRVSTRAGGWLGDVLKSIVKNHPDTLIAMENLAVSYGQLGRYQEAEPLEGIVLEKQKQLLGTDHPDTLLAMGNLAGTYCELGRYQEAEPLEGIVLAKRKQLLGLDHPHTLLAMGNLAATYGHLGRYQEAEPLQGIVLEKRKQLLCPDHPLMLLAMGNLAATYRHLGKYQEAEPLEGIVLEKRKQLLGPDHPDTLLAMGNLAVTYSQLGRYQEAESLEGIVLEKQKQLLGADHPDTLLAMANLAATYCELGRYQEAEPLQGIVLEKRKQLLGSDHPLMLSAMANVAATYCELGRYQEAESLEGIVLEKQKQLLGADHPDTLLAMGNLAVTYSQLGRYQEAEPLEGIVLEKQKQLLGPNHLDTLSAMRNLAATYCHLGRHQEAEYLQAQHEKLFEFPENQIEGE
ncbi:hypothetical protein B0H13DRAFT_2479113 [Mycena leptocephala]|nr:hypothetical protein B0H13DRAFT_2479113 [Mycena leptocephala]